MLAIMSQLPNRAAAAQAKLNVSASTGIRASLRSVIISVALGAVKVISGVVGHSYALIADGVESMLDVVSGAIVAGSLKIAAQPPDEKYPFGYGKVEPAAALVISSALLATAVGIAIQSVREIRMPHHAPAPFTLVVLVLVVVIKELLFRFLMRTGESIDSNAMRTDAWHHRSDSLTSAAAFIGISIALIGGEGYEPADDWAALFAAGVICVQRRACCCARPGAKSWMRRCPNMSSKKFAKSPGTSMASPASICAASARAAWACGSISTSRCPAT